jgi:hypothetical protein
VNEACNGASTGNASVTVSGGTGSYTYNWTPSGGTAATAGALSAGTYTCTITDANFCSLTKTITITEPSALSASTTQVNEACNGASTGSISTTVSGGTGAYTYNWTPSGGTAALAASLSAGTYTCLISDANSCNTSVTATISEPAAITYTASVSPATCGQSNGSASITAAGGTGALTYSWSPAGGNTSSAGNIPAGSYSCTITDANACSLVATTSVTNLNGPIVSVVNSTDVLCYGNATGSASVTVSSGTGAYTYSWIPSGGNGASAGSLTAGTYTCQVSDANGCIGSAGLTILQPAAFSVSSTQNNVTCNGASNGSATLSVNGGTATYTYSWNPSGGTASNASGLSGGTYTCTISDANACITSATVSITEPAALVAAITQETDVTCNGAMNGNVALTVSGGTGSYTYTWSPSGGNASSANGLAGGTYTCSISDANACSTSSTVTIAEPAALLASISQVANVTCNGAMNGNATVAVNGGTGSYTYNWSPSGGTSATESGLAGGTYTCSITDANACVTSVNVSIAEPSVLAAQAGVFTDASCNGVSDGSASIQANGGTAAYTYSWTPSGGTGAAAANLGAGTYTCTVTDANGCQASAAETISQPAPVTLTLTSTSPGACNGGADTLRASGAVSYIWSPATGLNNSTGSEVIATLTANTTYTITGTDASGCTGTNNISLNLNPDPATPLITSAGDVLSASGTGVLYQWYLNGSPLAGATSPDYTALATGTYMVTETNGFGCSATSAAFPFTITGSGPALAAGMFRLYPNPTQGDVTLELGVTGQHTEISFYDMLGQQVRTIVITDRVTTIHAGELSEGVYIYRFVRDGAVVSTGRLVMQ